MNTLTPEAIKLDPLRRNDVLQHVVFGVVNYIGKVRGNPNIVKISKTDRFTMTPQIVKCELRDLSRAPRKKEKKQATRLILCVCVKCELRMRVSQLWLNAGMPKCWNVDCEGGDLEPQYGDDESNPGKLGIDRSLMMKERNAQESGTMKKETPQDSGDDEFLTEAGKL